MAPKYKLTYFPFMAVAEPIRFMLSYSGIEWEDVRIEKANWPSHKSKAPFGKIPVLEVDGVPLHQALAVCRYLAKKCGLTGANEWEDLQIDMAADTLVDFRQEIGKYFYETDPAAKAKAKESIQESVFSIYLPRLEKQVKDNGGHLVGGKLTWADIVFGGYIDYVNGMYGEDLFKNFPNLKALKEKVWSIPSIKAWIAKRPVTPV